MKAYPVWFWFALAAIGTVVAGLLFFAGVRAAGTEILELRILDPDQKPILGAAVTYEHVPVGSGLVRLQDTGSGVVLTDSSGYARIPTKRLHLTQCRITHPQFVEVDIHIESEYGLGHHQTDVSWHAPPLTQPEKTGFPASYLHGFQCNLPASSRIPMTLYLPQLGDERPLPYPAQ